MFCIYRKILRLVKIFSSKFHCNFFQCIWLFLHCSIVCFSCNTGTPETFQYSPNALGRSSIWDLKYTFSQKIMECKISGDTMKYLEYFHSSLIDNCTFQNNKIMSQWATPFKFHTPPVEYIGNTQCRGSTNSK